METTIPHKYSKNILIEVPTKVLLCLYITVPDFRTNMSKRRKQKFIKIK